MKEPSGVRVKENTHRNLERGEACNINIGKLRSSIDKSQEKRENKEEIKINLDLGDENLRKTPAEQAFYENQTKKLKELEESRKQLKESSEESKRSLHRIDSPEKRLGFEDDEEEEEEKKEINLTPSPIDNQPQQNLTIIKEDK